MARRNISEASMPVGVSPEDIVPEAEAKIDATSQESILKSFDNIAPADKNFLLAQMSKLLSGIKGFAGFSPDPNAKKLKTVIKLPSQKLLSGGAKAVSLYLSGRGRIGDVYHDKFVSLFGVGKHEGVPESVAVRLEQEFPQSFKVV